MIQMSSQALLWNDFCRVHKVSETSVPLFEHDEHLTVSTKELGKREQRRVLKRSTQMDELLSNEVGKIVEDWKQGTELFDGLIYIMHKRGSDGGVVPLYIGKAEKYGKGDRNLSANLKDLQTSRGKFARWGDQYAYHIGDLSAVVLPGHQPTKRTRKYQSWADALFVSNPSGEVRLREEVFLWVKAWSVKDVSVWQDFGCVRLTFLEYLLIGVASHAFPGVLLNREGQNR
jgi:hypothetical protein